MTPADPLYAELLTRRMHLTERFQQALADYQQLQERQRLGITMLPELSKEVYGRYQALKGRLKRLNQKISAYQQIKMQERRDARRADFRHHFLTVAREQLSPETFDGLCKAAQARLDAAATEEEQTLAPDQTTPAPLHGI